MKLDKKNIQFSTMKFGRLPKIEDERTFRIANYLKAENLTKIPKQYNWGKKINPNNWGDLGNLKINNCTCAVAGHLIMAWSSNTGRLKRPTTRSIINTYAEVSNYNPKTNENDEGIESIKVLKYWRKNNIAGYKIVAFAKLEDKNRQQLMSTIYLFGGCYVGLNLPKTAEKQWKTTGKWTIPRTNKKADAKSGTWFSHAVLITGYKGEDLRIITWGEEMIMTMDFWEAYSEESYAVFSEVFIKYDKTPTGIDVDILKNDIENIKKQKAEKKIPLS